MQANNQGMLYTALRASLSFRPDHVAIRHQGREITNATFLARIDEAAEAFSDIGVNPHDVVTLVLSNIPEALVALYALNKLGAISFLVNPQIPLNSIRGWLQQFSSSYVLCLDKNASSLAALVGDQRHMLIVCSAHDEEGTFPRFFSKKAKYPRHSLIHSFPDLLSKKRHHFTRLMKEVQSYVFSDVMPALLMTSGGTSGERRIIALSNQALNAFAKKLPVIAHPLNLTEESALALLPYYHGFGFGVAIHGMLLSGATLDLIDKFHTAEVIRLIKEKKLSLLFGVPTVYRALANNREFACDALANVKRAYVGGDFLTSGFADRLNQLFSDHHSQARLWEGYGLTEAVAAVTVASSSTPPDAVGRPLPGLSLRIVDPESGANCSAGIGGEICVAGDTLMSGYVFDETGTAKALRYEEGRNWIHTGDYGYVDTLGNLYFRQRLKRLVKVSGLTVCPSDIEKMVEKLELVDEAVATAMPDDYKGSMIKLFVSLTDPALAKDPLRRERFEGVIRDIIKAELPVYAIPKEIVFLDRIPKLASGKVDYRLLERMSQ